MLSKEKVLTLGHLDSVEKMVTLPNSVPNVGAAQPMTHKIGETTMIPKTIKSSKFSHILVVGPHEREHGAPTGNKFIKETDVSIVVDTVGSAAG